jgi:hypothetical protein
MEAFLEMLTILGYVVIGLVGFTYFLALVCIFIHIFDMINDKNHVDVLDRISRNQIQWKIKTIPKKEKDK